MTPGNTTSYGYDPIFGNLATVTAPLTQGNRSFEYISDSTGCDNGFLWKETHPESGDTTYEHSCLGLVTRRTRVGGEVTTSSYDRAGRLTGIAYPDAAGSVALGYDGAGHRTSLSNLSASATLTFDNAGRLETVTRDIVGGPTGLVTSYGYDSLDRLHTITYPSGRVVTYGWDDRNWLTSVTGEEGSGVEYISDVTYYSSGAPHLVTFANSVATSYAIDPRNRVRGITTKRGASTYLKSVGLQYDFASNVTYWQDYLDPANSRVFGYDDLNRLTSAWSPGLWGSLAYTYDELGNRRTETHDGGVTTYVYDGSTSRLSGLTGAEGTTFEYDDLGRVTREASTPWDEIFSDGFESGDTSAWGGGTSPPGTLIYTFNAADQLLEVEESGQPLGVYGYDGDGLRVSATSGGETVYYLRNEAGDTLAEYDGGGQLIAEYLYANGRQIGKVEPDGAGGDKVSTFHPDHLGTAMLITSDTGVVTWHGEYEPFGEPVTSTGTPDRYRFTQHELDTETDLVYAKARYYHPKIGRFLSVDPATDTKKATESPQSWNKYAYALNNPTRYVDPDGRLVFESDPEHPVSQQDIKMAYQAQEDLRQNLTPAVKTFFEEAFGADLQQLLTPGRDPTVQLSKGNPALEGRVGQTKGGDIKLNASLDLWGNGGKLGQAGMLHESAHWARGERSLGLSLKNFFGVPMDSQTRAIREQRLNDPTIPEAARFLASWDAPEGQAAEILQFGDILTLTLP